MTEANSYAQLLNHNENCQEIFCLININKIYNIKIINNLIMLKKICLNEKKKLA